jgi:hypothetical protein
MALSRVHCQSSWKAVNSVEEIADGFVALGSSRSPVPGPVPRNKPVLNLVVIATKLARLKRHSGQNQSMKTCDLQAFEPFNLQAACVTCAYASSTYKGYYGCLCTYILCVGRGGKKRVKAFVLNKVCHA